MADRLTFFHIRDPKQHAMTRSGYKVLESAGHLIVYCTDDGPLDPRYRPEWNEWRMQPKQVEPRR